MILIVCLTSLALSAPLDLLEVNAAAGPYFEISDAVLAARDGDVIRVAPGTYGSFAIRGKSVSVVAPSTALVFGVVRVQELGPGQTSTLENLTLLRASGQDESPLIIGLNQGSVRCAGVAVPNQTPLVAGGGSAQAMARVVNCADVSFVNCDLYGGSQVGAQLDVLPALLVTNSNVAVFGGTIQGLGNNAGTALVARGSHIDLMGVEVRGGWGSSEEANSGGSGCLYFAQEGGTGLVAENSSTLRVGGSISGGAGGQLYCDPSSGQVYVFGWGFLANGDAVELVGTSTVDERPGPGVLTSAPALAAEGTTVSIAVEDADPLDLMLLVDGPMALRRPLPGFVGALLLGGPVGTVQRRVIGVGPVTTTYDLPFVGDRATEPIHVQAVALRTDPTSPTGRRVLFGAPRVVQVLDSVY